VTKPAKPDLRILVLGAGGIGGYFGGRLTKDEARGGSRRTSPSCRSCCNLEQNGKQREGRHLAAL
jgi:hypothetical protein